MAYRPLISFDLDGVIADGAYVPLERRTNAYYFTKKPVDPMVMAYLSLLSNSYDIFIISARSHSEANLGIRVWLSIALGLGPGDIAGVITPPGIEQRMDKAAVVRALGIEAHFDDDANHVSAMPGVGVLFPSEISRGSANLLPTAPDWATVREFLATPGYVLHGSGGQSVVSPATLDMRALADIPLEMAMPVGGDVEQ